MDRQHKVWGERWLLRVDDMHAVSFLKVEPGFKCSWHRHKTKYNLFAVLKGALIIKTEELEGVLKETILGKGECFTVRPGQFHEFYAKEYTEVIEEMYVSYQDADIERIVLGGKL